MRILTFLHSFELGGVERIALRLVRSWRENGADAPLFMGRVDGPMRGELADGLTDLLDDDETDLDVQTASRLRAALRKVTAVTEEGAKR